MNVHNVMEEYVSNRVNALYDQLKVNKPAWLTCSCESCRLDAVSYVLNKIQPHYIVSGRGVVYTSKILEDSQIKADVDALAMEGIKLIASVQRPYHKKAAEQQLLEKDEASSPRFNFPVFIGSIYNGATFEPLPDASITLKMDDSIVEMKDSSWSNPVNTYKATKGAYSFWPKPIPAEKSDINHNYHFTVEAAAKDFGSASYGFDITVVSENKKRSELNSALTLKIQDIFLFQSDLINPME